MQLEIDHMPIMSSVFNNIYIFKLSLLFSFTGCIKAALRLGNLLSHLQCNVSFISFTFYFC